jgi:bacillaene synthase trans-acting acyltransferase
MNGDGLKYLKKGPTVPDSETIFMFSGQGSQYYHMGKPLYDGNGTFRDWMVRLDGVAREFSGHSVIEALYSPKHRKSDVFDRLLLTHPAIFMVEYSLAQTLMQAGVRPDMVLGASLGTFAAAAVAGFMDAEDALIAVMQQAAVFEECCEPGGMTAVLADPALFAEDFLRTRSELAAVNFSSHFVVSARRRELEEIETEMSRRNVSYQRLPVSFPFHSQWIDQVQGRFESCMKSLRCRPGQLPLVCCDQAAILSDLSSDHFWNVVRRPIRFRETTARLEQQGSRRYIDVGPAGTLATFLKYGMSAATRSTAHGILTPFGLDQKNLAAVLASIRN